MPEMPEMTKISLFLYISLYFSKFSGFGQIPALGPMPAWLADPCRHGPTPMPAWAHTHAGMGPNSGPERSQQWSREVPTVVQTGPKQGQTGPKQGQTEPKPGQKPGPGPGKRRPVSGREGGMTRVSTRVVRVFGGVHARVHHPGTHTTPGTHRCREWCG